MAAVALSGVRRPPRRGGVTAQGGRPAAPGRVERIAVVRALPGVGDLLCAVPALRAVRAAHRHAHVTLVGLPGASWFVDRFSALVDDLLVAVGVDGLPEIAPDPGAAADLRARARARRFDLALQVHGSGVASNPLTTLLGARRQVTARLPGQWRPPGTVIPYPGDVHEVERLLAVTRAAGMPDAATDASFPLGPADHAAAAALRAQAGGGTPGTAYACVHPGAARPANRWPPWAFAAVADRLGAAGLRVLLTGTAAERAVAAEVAGRSAGPVADLSGRTSVATLAALFAGARVVVSGDTGAHVAAAVHVPSVVVFGPGGDPVRWAPRDGVRHRAVPPAPGWPTVAAVLAALDDALTAPTLPGVP